MTESNYNLYAKHSKGIVCFNTLYQTVVLMSSTLFELLKKKQYEQIAPQTFQMLVDNWILIEDNVNELEKLKLEAANVDNNGIYDLTILPSLDCNLRCWYCFENHIKGSHLDIVNQERIFAHAKQVLERNDIKKIRVELFGGEPLLYFKDEVYPMLIKIRNFANIRKKEFVLNIITNAVCIDRDVIPLFASLNATFQISIDGYKEKHDSVKKMHGSKTGTYDKVMQAIHDLTNAYNTYINLRINYDNQTLKHIKEVIEDIDDIDRRKIGLHLERVWQTNPTEGESGYGVKEAINMILSKGFVVSYMNLFRRSISCKAGKKNQAALSYNGDVYKCTGRDFTERLREGTLLDNGTINWDEEKRNRRLSVKTYDNLKCKVCKLLPLCWGPCCQKVLENVNAIEKECQRNMEMSLDDYVLYRFNNELVKSKLQC